ncbi:hypothetical protein OO006_06590 [Prosthecochloris sp. SCSIO W1101]|uniref:hypothetical protein n=1 Tax=Prosthecochloris sp. SCSIO W1101 TaxID=2992242 RepID=UPI00223CCB38|nr:hypothetical protein [Prosthecochloris sp. SCSIO W1101]UZJ42610.1 hypothetical protein OO006_06590 [Prosthecochloris sp. SCSIO W1101]
MNEKEEKKMINPLSEGPVKLHFQLDLDGKVLRGCGCCLCAPNKAGAGDVTAKISGGTYREEILILEGSMNPQ